VRQVDGAEAPVPPLGRLGRIDDRVGPFHRQDVAERLVLGVGFIFRPVGVQLSDGADLAHQAPAFEQVIVFELPSGGRRGDLLAARIERVAGEHRAAGE
jgi:hypothetical protein